MCPLNTTVHILHGAWATSTPEERKECTRRSAGDGGSDSLRELIALFGQMEDVRACRVLSTPLSVLLLRAALTNDLRASHSYAHLRTSLEGMKEFDALDALSYLLKLMADSGCSVSLHESNADDKTLTASSSRAYILTTSFPERQGVTGNGPVIDRVAASLPTTDGSSLPLRGVLCYCAKKGHYVYLLRAEVM